MSLPNNYAYINHKQGDSFNYSGPILIEQSDAGLTTDFSGWGGIAQIKRDDGTLVTSLLFDWISAADGILQIRDDGDTSNWPIGRVLLDIELTTPNGDVVSTDTVVVLIEKDISQ